LLLAQWEQAKLENLVVQGHFVKEMLCPRPAMYGITFTIN